MTDSTETTDTRSEQAKEYIEKAKKYSSLFDKLDTDKSGFISYAEAEKHFAQYGVAGTEALAWIRENDTTGSGTIQRFEFVAAMEAFFRESKEMDDRSIELRGKIAGWQKKFEELSGGETAITLDRLVTVTGKTREEAEEIMAELDKDKSGSITFEEYAAYLEAVEKKLNKERIAKEVKRQLNEQKKENERIAEEMKAPKTALVAGWEKKHKEYKHDFDKLSGGKTLISYPDLLAAFGKHKNPYVDAVVWFMKMDPEHNGTIDLTAYISAMEQAEQNKDRDAKLETKVLGYWELFHAWDTKNNGRISRPSFYQIVAAFPEKVLPSKDSAPEAELLEDGGVTFDVFVHAIEGKEKDQHMKQVLAENEKKYKGTTPTTGPQPLRPGELRVRVISGKKLEACDLNGLSDPYIILELGEQKKRTTIKLKTLNPIWEEEFKFRVGNPKTEVLTVRVMDWDRLKSDDFMGDVQIKILDIANVGFKAEADYVLSDKQDPHGTIQLELQFTAKV